MKNGVLLVFLFAIASCSSPEEAETKNQSGTQSPEEVFTSVRHLRPFHCIEADLQNQKCILCIADKNGKTYKNKMFVSEPDIHYYQINQEGDSWILAHEKPILKQSHTYCTVYPDFEQVKLNNRNYLYFILNIVPMGNATTYESLYFSLFSLENHRYYFLEYGGEIMNDDTNKIRVLTGEFVNEDPETYEMMYLLKRANESGYIHHYGPEDDDTSLTKNYALKWSLDNRNFNMMKSNAETKLNISYYDEKLIDENRSADKIENENYIFIAEFRGSVLGYDKKKKKYFPLIINDCMRGCDFDIQFLDENTLQIIHVEHNNFTATVDLGKMVYSAIQE